MLGQPAAVARAVEVVSTLKAGLADIRRPSAVLLFAGRTGVGKTELAKALAEYIFGSRDRLVRLDMGEAKEGTAAGSTRERDLAEARRFFRPEFFNRLDDVVVFSSLGAEQIRIIVEREIGHLKDRTGFRRHDVSLEVDSASLDWLASRGLDPRYGARPLKRAIERELVVPVAGYLASHPSKGAIRLLARADSQRLGLDAESIARDEEGGARQAILELFNEASDLRAEVRRWIRSPPMERSRESLLWFDRASKQPAF